MKSLFYSMLLVTFTNFLYAQEQEEIRFFYMGGFIQHATALPGTSDNRTAGGFTARIGKEYYFEKEKSRMGGSEGIEIGWGGHGYVPYVLDADLYYTSRLTAGQEAGFSFAPVGLYAVRHWAAFGSRFSLFYRIQKFQLEYSRMGAGIVAGFIAPKDKQRTVNSIALSYLISDKLIASLRYLNAAPSGQTTDSPVKATTDEIRFTFCYSMKTWENPD